MKKELIEKEVDMLINEAEQVCMKKANWIEKNLLGVSFKPSQKERETYIAFATAGFFVGEKYACDKLKESFENKQRSD